jgi:hypothetical protein
MHDPSEIISGQNIAAKCDYVFSQTICTNGSPAPYIADHFPEIKGGELIFCKTDFIHLLHQCVDKFVPFHVRFTVITHDSDYPLSDELIHRFGNRPIYWWGVNCESQKGNPLPIGVANSYSRGNLQDFHGTPSPSRLLYVNNRVHNYPILRNHLYEYFSTKEWATVRVPYEHNDIDPRYKGELLDHKFILCPRGNGVDTHRMWEALYSGVVPIVVRNRTHAGLEGELPILFVNDYSEITEDVLNATYDEFKNRTWNTDMLKVSWWINRMRRQGYVY